MKKSVEEFVNVSEINQYLYCPRRLYYIKFYNTIGENYEIRDGILKHEKSSTRGGWIKSMFLKSVSLGIKGKIDVIEDEDFPIPIERKRAKSGKYYKNDEYQLVSYCLLLEDELNEKIPYGYIYLFSSDERHKIKMTKDKRKKVEKIIQEIKNLSVEKPPAYASNLNKCKKCSTRKFCMPKESEKLGERG